MAAAKPERLNEKIRRLRLEQGYQLKQLAEYLSISSGYLARCEAGDQRLPDAKLRKLCKALGIDVSDMLENDIKVPTKELQKKVDSDPYFMKLLRVLLESRQPTKKIIAFVTRDNERPIQE